jgi:hypothetical protein
VANRVQQILWDVAFHSGIQSSDHVIFIRMHAEQDDGSFRTPLQNLRSSIDAIEKRHGDVHDDKRGGEFFGKFNSLMAICGLSNNLCLLDSSEQERQAFPHDVVIVCENDSRLAHLAVTAGKRNFHAQERSAVGP